MDIEHCNLLLVDTDKMHKTVQNKIYSPIYTLSYEVTTEIKYIISVFTLIKIVYK